MRYGRLRVAVIGACVYLVVFAAACLYPVFDHRTFSGLFAVMLALPWIDFLPHWHFAILIAVGLNALVIFLVLALVACAIGAAGSVRPG